MQGKRKHLRPTAVRSLEAISTFFDWYETPATNLLPADDSVPADCSNGVKKSFIECRVYYMHKS